MEKIFVRLAALKIAVHKKLFEKSGNQLTTYLGLVILAVVAVSFLISNEETVLNGLMNKVVEKIESLFKL